MIQEVNKNNIKDLSGLLMLTCLFLMAIILLSIAKGAHFSNFLSTSAEAGFILIVICGGTRFFTKSWRYINTSVLAALIIFLLPHLSKIGSNGIESLQWISTDEVSEIAKEIAQTLPKDISDDIVWQSAASKDRFILLSFYQKNLLSNNSDIFFTQWVIKNYCNLNNLHKLKSTGISISFTLTTKNGKSDEILVPKVCTNYKNNAQ
jgi:hypothetical protein